LKAFEYRKMGVVEINQGYTNKIVSWTGELLKKIWVVPKSLQKKGLFMDRDLKGAHIVASHTPHLILLRGY
jgi:hypothetical protein